MSVKVNRIELDKTKGLTIQVLNGANEQTIFLDGMNITITVKGPAELSGHLFNFNNAPNRYGLPAFYELHVWAWKKNRKGAFTDMNPDVSCDAMAK